MQGEIENIYASPLPRTQYDKKKAMHIKNKIFCFIWSGPEHLPPQTVGCLPFHAHPGQLPLVRVSLDVAGSALFFDCVRSPVQGLGSVLFYEGFRKLG